MDIDVKENNVRQTNLRQADAKVAVVGIVSDKKLEMKTENGVRTIEGTVTIKTSDTNFVQMRVKCSDKKKNDGSINRAFAGIMTVMNEYKSIADVGEDEADRVRVSGQINPFRSNNTGDEIISYTGSFFNRIKPNQNFEPKAEFEVEMYIERFVPEFINNEETGRYKICGWTPTYNGIEPLTLFVPEELAEAAANAYQPRQTARFYGNIIQNITYKVTNQPMAFGVKTKTESEFINRLVVTGGSTAYNAETEDEVIKGGNQIPYNPVTIQAAIDERDRRIKEEQNKPRTNTTINNARPSGASRGRTLPTF